MGMYCCCDEKISRDDFNCKCDWERWRSVFDWPQERKNRHIPIGLPEKDGVYLVRIQTSCADRYEDEKHFSVIPRIEKNSGYRGDRDIILHWEGETWEEGTPYAWKEIQ